LFVDLAQSVNPFAALTWYCLSRKTSKNHQSTPNKKSINKKVEEKLDKLNFIQVTSARQFNQFKLKIKRIPCQTLI
jgi:hypothetical protein